MSDGYVDLSPILSAINSLGATVNRVGSQVVTVDNHVREVDQRLAKLKKEVEQMREDQRKNAALQRALTEIIRVRQELEQKFGNQQLVRDSMQNILDVKNLAIMKHTIIENCTQELMMHAPNYWLAPCVVAIAAWINNQEALAARAIELGYERSPDKTSLLMALICRMNGRTKACFKWLEVYFRTQNPHNMKRSVVTFIGAYYSGIFGHDEKNVCADTISEWMKILAKNENFAKEQKEYWKDFFAHKCRQDAMPLVTNSAGYKALSEMSPQFASIDNFVARIEAVNGEYGAKDKFKAIVTATVDEEKIKEEINKKLEALITEYEEAEVELRGEERFYTLVKEYAGDEDYAREEMEFEKLYFKDDPLNLAERLSAVLVADSVSDDGSLSAEKKASLFLLKGYIVDAYKEFITECKGGYPEKISLKHTENYFIEGQGSGVYPDANNKIIWTAETEKGENREELKRSLEKEFDKKRDQELAKVKIPGWYWVFVIPGLVGLYKTKKIKEEISRKYALAKSQAVKKLDSALDGYVNANKLVEEFCGKEGWETINVEEAM